MLAINRIILTLVLFWKTKTISKQIRKLYYNIEANSEAILQNQQGVESNAGDIASNLQQIEANTQALSDVAVFPSYDYRDFIVAADITEKVFEISKTVRNAEDPPDYCDRERHVITRDTGSVSRISVSLQRFESVVPPINPDVITCQQRPGSPSPMPNNFGFESTLVFELGDQNYSLVEYTYSTYSTVDGIVNFVENYLAPLPMLTVDMKTGLPWGDMVDVTTTNDLDDFVQVQHAMEIHTLMEVGTVDVPYGTLNGTLTGCLKILSEREGSARRSYTRINWYCPGLGLVKISQAYGYYSREWQLIDVIRN
jgi:hypothetical protein